MQISRAGTSRSRHGRRQHPVNRGARSRHGDIALNPLLGELAHQRVGAGRHVEQEPGAGIGNLGDDLAALHQFQVIGHLVGAAAAADLDAQLVLRRNALDRDRLIGIGAAVDDADVIVFLGQWRDRGVGCRRPVVRCGRRHHHIANASGKCRKNACARAQAERSQPLVAHLHGELLC
jgi:hypothetical protein